MIQLGVEKRRVFGQWLWHRWQSYYVRIIIEEDGVFDSKVYFLLTLQTIYNYHLQQKNLGYRFKLPKKTFYFGAAIAPCYRLCPQSCGRTFESQAHHIRFFNLNYLNCKEKRKKINNKEAGIGPFFKNKTFYYPPILGLTYLGRTALW